MEILGIEPFWCNNVDELNKVLVFGYNLEKEGFLKTISYNDGGDLMFVEWTRHEIPISKFIAAYPTRIFDDYRKQIMNMEGDNAD